MNYLTNQGIKTILRILDTMYDELLIYDNAYNIVYINNACSRHYGCRPSQMIGKSFYDFVSYDWWNHSILPVVYKEKKAFCAKQSTYLGAKLLTIAVPVFDHNGELQYVVMNVRDEVNDIDLYYPDYVFSELQEEDVSGLPFGTSLEMQAVLKQIKRVADMKAPCTIYGEAGAGKTALAQYLHTLSAKKSGGVTVFNCAGLPDEIVEQELFGTKEEPGLLDKMEGKTLIMKNIHGLSDTMQMRLLHYLEHYTTAGGKEYKPARIISTSEVHLKFLVRQHSFNESLYQMLSLAEVHVPALRQRKEDIAPMVSYFLGCFCSRYGINRSVTDGALRVLMNYNWPGNIRELRYVIERLMITADTPVIDLEQLPKSLFGIDEMEEDILPEPANARNFDEMVDNYQSLIVNEAYRKASSSRLLAKELGVSQTKANHLIQKYVTGRGRTKL